MQVTDAGKLTLAIPIKTGILTSTGLSKAQHYAQRETAWKTVQSRAGGRAEIWQDSGHHAQGCAFPTFL